MLSKKKYPYLTTNWQSYEDENQDVIDVYRKHLTEVDADFPVHSSEYLRLGSRAAISDGIMDLVRNTLAKRAKK